MGKSTHDEDDDVLIHEDEKPKGKARHTVDEDEDDRPAKGSGKKSQARDDDDDRPAKSQKGDDGALADDVDFGDEGLMKRKDALEKLTPEKGKFVRFSLLPFVKPKKAMIHYVKGKGYAVCNSTPDLQAICCKRLGDSSARIAALVVQYSNADSRTGKLDPEKPLTYEVKCLLMSQPAFREVSMLPEEDASPYDMDITMTTRENGIGYTFRRMKSKATWKLNKELAGDVEEECAKFLDGKILSKKLGKRMNSTDLRVWIGDPADADDDSVMDDL